MTFLVERLAALRRHLQHLREIRPRVADATALVRDLSLHNDVLYSLFTVCQLVLDISGELSVKHNRRIESYAEAIRNLDVDSRFSSELVHALERLSGFRNVLVDKYVPLDMQRVVEALDNLAPVETFADVVAAIEREEKEP